MSGVIKIVEDDFGILQDDQGNSQVIKRFTLTNSTGLFAQVITYGATLTSLKVPDKNGHIDDVILGFDDMEGYLGRKVENPYFGATIGRVTNRIANATFTLDGQEFKLSVNAASTHPTVVGNHNLHGGFVGFDKRVWEAHVVQGKGVTLSYTSKDGEEGFPGDVLVNVTFELTPSSNDMSIRYQATSTKKTPVMLTSHPYFNLSGHQNADKGLGGHWLMINAETFTPVDQTYIPTGEYKSVAGSEFDFRTRKNLSDKLLQKYPDCYNHNFPVNGKFGGQPRLGARLDEENSGRILEVWTDQPSIMLYTSNYMPPPGTEPVPGKEGARYFRYGALCLESQNHPDAINQPNFPDPVLTPGDVYIHQIIFKFSVAK